jgi:hypothetical protein
MTTAATVALMNSPSMRAMRAQAVAVAAAQTTAGFHRIGAPWHTHVGVAGLNAEWQKSVKAASIGADLHKTITAMPIGANYGKAIGAGRIGADVRGSIGAGRIGAEYGKLIGVGRIGADLHKLVGAGPIGADLHKSIGPSRIGAEYGKLIGVGRSGADLHKSIGASRIGAGYGKIIGRAELPLAFRNIIGNPSDALTAYAAAVATAYVEAPRSKRAELSVAAADDPEVLAVLHGIEAAVNDLATATVAGSATSSKYARVALCLSIVALLWTMGQDLGSDHVLDAVGRLLHHLVFLVT